MTSELMPRLGGARTWKDDEPLECVSVVPDGPDVVSFSFRSPSGAWFDYRPGQFLTLELPAPGRADPPHLHDLLEPVAAALDHPDGEGGGRQRRHAAGCSTTSARATRVKAIGPGGIFVPDVPPDRKLLLISAGSGVTPMMAITTYRWDIGGAARHLLRAVRAAAVRARVPAASGAHGEPRAVDQAALRRRARTTPTGPGPATAAPSTS